MKFTLFFLTFALSVAFFAYANEECFDKDRTQEEWKPVKEECRTTVTETEPVERVRLITRCILQKKGLLSDDLVLDYPKFKEAGLALAVHHKDEIEHLMQDCWENKGSDDHALRNFFLCYREKLQELCPETKKWEEEDDH